MDIISRGIPFNPLQRWQWKGRVSLPSVPAEVRAWPHRVGSQSITQATTVVQGRHCSLQPGVDHAGAGGGRQGEPHLKHMVMATGRGRSLKLIEVLFQNKRKGFQAGEPHRCPLHTLRGVGLLTPLLPTQTMTFSGVTATWSYSQYLGMIELQQYILSCVS